MLATNKLTCRETSPTSSRLSRLKHGTLYIDDESMDWYSRTRKYKQLLSRATEYRQQKEKSVAKKQGKDETKISGGKFSRQVSIRTN
jgi:hypothetical protein